MWLVVLLLVVLCVSVYAGTLDVGRVTDARLHVKRGTDTRFELRQFSSLEEWQSHADAVRERILTGCGLNPMPEKTPLKAKVFGRIDRGDYTIEKCSSRAIPDSTLWAISTGPRAGPAGFRPFYVRTATARAEDPELSSDYCQPARAISIARLGMVVFSYSMIGYNENTHIQHRFATSPRQELWAIGPGALQLWNSIRAVDFVSSLPDVDPERIGCTGESGGGTQTFILSAVEPRIKVNAPVCMISAIMQGGCVCENGPLWRIDSNSVEIGGLMAPRPMMMIAATGDWTKETMEHEYPFTRSIYRLYGAESNVKAWLQDTGHNYNTKSREHVYPWLQRFLLGDKTAGETTPEKPVAIGDIDDFIVYKTPPKDAITLDKLTEDLIASRKSQIDGFGIKSRASLDRYRRTFGPALRACFAVSAPAAADIVIEDRGSVDLANCRVSKLVIGRRGTGDAIPALLFTPNKPDAKAAPVVIVHREGKSALLADGAPGDVVDALLAKGRAVLAIDTFLTGETDRDDERLKQTFFTTFYRTDSAERVQDVVTALNYASLTIQQPQAQQQAQEPLALSTPQQPLALSTPQQPLALSTPQQPLALSTPQQPLALSRPDRAVSKGSKGVAVDLIGVAGSGLDCLFARAFAGIAGSTAIDLDGFDASDDAFAERFFVPCIRRVGDVRTAAAMIAPGRLTIYNAGKGFPADWIKRAYAASGSPKGLTVADSASAAKELVAGL